MWWSKVDPATELGNVVDPAIDALSQDERRELAAIWQKRGSLELHVAAGFSTIAFELLEHGAVQPVLEIVGRAVRDEMQHTIFSIDIAARYRGDDPVWPSPEGTHVPDFAPASPGLRTALHVLAMCCINETIACACLEAALEQTKSPLVRCAQQLILQDEVDHARAGWAHLASAHVTPDMRQELSGWLVRLFSAKFRDLAEGTKPLPGESFPDHGMLSRKVSTEVCVAAFDEVIFPGLAQAGLDVSAVEAWSRETFPR